MLLIFSWFCFKQKTMVGLLHTVSYFVIEERAQPSLVYD